MSKVIFLLGMVITILITAPLSIFLANRVIPREGSILSPLVQPEASPKPLLAYTIPTLAARNYQPSQLKITSVINETDEFTSYVFSYQTLGKTMTGQLNVPKQVANPTPAIVLLRGYVPAELFQTGVGTKNAAAAFAKAGFVTLAPDFFGYGGSDPEPTDSWQARFEKPIIVMELLKTLETVPLELPADLPKGAPPKTITINRYGLWGHSNGGQIALTTLEVLGKPVPTTLWAPVTAPFPYSILFFSDESDDEGKGMRKWLASFERDYDVFDFTLTKHLDRLTGPIQLHHGSADEAALKVWSDEFVDKVKAENKRRTNLTKYLATASAEVASPAASPLPHPPLPLIELEYFSYPGADHNLQPAWQTVVDRDIAFFQQHLQDD